MHRVFIDGQAGTTGLEIAGRLESRRDIRLLVIDDEVRKDPKRRAALLNEADVVVLCLPDSAAREAVALIDNPRTRVIDASTAHRVAAGWTYGLPELAATQREAIAASERVANPGCYATGFILTVRPLIEAGLLSANRTLSAFALSGYSGGGRTMIERYRAAADRGAQHVLPPMTYGLDLAHKHVAEMTLHSTCARPPIFSPIVAHYYKGMLVHVPLDAAALGGADAMTVHAALRERYAHEPCIRVLPFGAAQALDGGYLEPTAANDTNRIDLMVFGDADRSLVVTRYDNLGKGAAGAAIQNLNLMIGAPELTGICV